VNIVGFIIRIYHDARSRNVKIKPTPSHHTVKHLTINIKVQYDTAVSIYFAFEIINEEAPADTSEQHKVTSAFISNMNMTGGGRGGFCK